MLKKSLLVASALWGISVNAVADAAGAEGRKPPEAARPLTTLDFFRHPLISEAKLSPDGRYLAVLVPKGDKSRLDIVEVASMRGTAAYDMGLGEFVANFYWINNNQFVWEGAKRWGSLDVPYLTGNLMLGRADKSKGRTLGDAQVFLDRVRDSPDTILVSWDRKIYRENIDTDSIKQVAEVPFDSADVVSDHQGVVRFVSGVQKDEVVTDVWDEAKRGWKELRRLKLWNGDVTPLVFAPDNRHLYVLSNTEAPTTGMYLLDTVTGESQLLFRDPKVDAVTYLDAPGSGEPGGMLYFPDYPAYRFFDENSALAKTYAELRSAFPNCKVVIASSSDDGRMAVVSVESDRQPAVFYLMNLEKHSLQRLFSSMPWIDPQQMSEMSAFVIKARDGVELHGYLTTPRVSGEKNLPLIVLPHGGPHGVRDYWGFDPEVQYLAYNGYAVLQLNFRGSGGYGRDLENLGLGHWGTTMQDDLTDATRWAIAEGIADPKRICIFGASYGGYAALMGVIREPDLYRCAVSYVGVTDLTVQRIYSDTANSAEGRAYFDVALGTNKDDLKARSPVYNVDKIKVPLFLAAGGSDPRVPIENFKVMTSALDHAGKRYETLVKDEEGHGFYSESNQVELYEHILDFIDRNIGLPAK